MRVVIIEDEKKAAQRVSELLSSIDDTIEVVAMVDSIEASVAHFESHPHPDLVLSDIQLADGLCFEIFNSVKVSCPIIFLTAFDQYMVEAFNTNAVSYLLKPINREQLERALLKLKDMQEAFGAPQSDKQLSQIEALVAQLSLSTNFKKTLIVNRGERIIPLSVQDIAYLYSKGKLLLVTTFSGEEYLYSSTLDEMDEMLDGALFFRANRQFIINRNAISSIERYFNRKLSLKLSVIVPEQIVVSRIKAQPLLDWLEG